MIASERESQKTIIKNSHEIFECTRKFRVSGYNSAINVSPTSKMEAVSRRV
jgi:hypothetical protein